MLGRLPSVARFCGRSCATVAKDLSIAKQPKLSVSQDLRNAKDLSMVRIVEVFRARENEFTPAHCFATLVMMDSEASERAHTKRGYEINLEATAKLPETRRLFLKAAADARSFEPHMFANLLILTHAFGLEEYPDLTLLLMEVAKEKLPRLTDAALEQIVETIGEDKRNYWSALVLSYLPERPRQTVLPTANEKNLERLQQRQPLAKLLCPVARQEISEEQLARIADSTLSLGAIDPNDLHTIVAVYADAGVRNIRFLRLIRDFAIVSCRQLAIENLWKLHDEFERIGMHDKAVLEHLIKRQPSNPALERVNEDERRHTQKMAILTRIDRPWSQPRFGKRYAEPEWDSSIDNRENYFMLSRQERLSGKRKEENIERIKKGLPRVPFDGIMCPWLGEQFYGGRKKIMNKTPKHKLFPGFSPE